MNSRISLQQFKGLLFVQSLFVLPLLAPSMANAAIKIKDTNYPIPQSAYFVAPNGRVTNSGKSPNSPWPVDQAIKLAPRGATIVFMGGTYRNISAKINKKLTLQAYPHSKPWLKGSVVVKGWVREGNKWRKDNWKYSFPHNKSRRYIDPKYPLAGHRDMVYINGRSLRQVGSRALVGPGKFYVDAARNRLYIGNNPAGKIVEATALYQAFDIWKGRLANPANTAIRGLGFAHYADEAVHVAAPGVKLENNTFVWNGLHGVKFGGSGFQTDGILRGNTFSYNGKNGVWGFRAHRLLLQANTIAYNNVEQFAKTWDAAGIKLVLTDRSSWRNNLVEHNSGSGMWLDLSSTNATIVNNTVRHNESFGIYFELSHLAIIASNIAYNNGVGIGLTDSSSVRVYNNTLASNHKNLRIKDRTREITDAKQRRAGVTGIARNNVVKNNILSNTSGGPLFEGLSCETKKNSAAMIAAADYNAYYRTVSSKPQSIITWSLGASRCSAKYASIAAFNSATGFEAHGLAIANATTNPFFVNEARGGYRLKPGSPAIGRGAPLPADIARAIGLRAGVRVDLGALQSKAVLVQ